jgi:low temperature requirement protein LtrA
MHKRPFAPAEGVSNIELFYDLIFVYGINVVTTLCRNPQGGFLNVGMWLIYLFSFLVILQVWFFTTLLMNRYGDRSPFETAGLFANMFLLYFLANGVRLEWHETAHMFNLTWAAILLNLALQWLFKLRAYTNLDRTDRSIMLWTIVSLAVQAGLAVIAAFLPERPSEVMSWVTLLFGMSVWGQSKLYREKPARFSHLAERCSLLTIIAFGEMVVGISSYMTGMSSAWYPVGVFLLTVGLFLIYIFEHDFMLDHDARTDGMRYTTISSWLVVVIGNLTLAFEYMPMEEVAFLPKSIYLSACLVLYLLTSFLLGIYNKPQYRYSRTYVVARLVACAFIILIGIGTSFDPGIGLACHVATVYTTLAHEVILLRRRDKIEAMGSSLGITHELAGEAHTSVEHTSS